MNFVMWTTLLHYTVKRSVVVAFRSSSIIARSRTRQPDSEKRILLISRLPYTTTTTTTALSSLAADHHRGNDNDELLLPNNNNNNNKTKKKVLIVGAGISGLAVAYRLRHVADCRIIEARNRIGGRIHSINVDVSSSSSSSSSNTDNNEDNCATTTTTTTTCLELGGQWIHEASDKNPIVRLLKDELNIPLLYATLESTINKMQRGKRRSRGRAEPTLFDKEGKRIPIAIYKAAFKFLHKAFEKADPKRFGGVDTSLQDILDQAVADALPTIYGQEDLHNNPQFKSVLNYLIHRTECYEGGRFHELSPFLDETYVNLGGPDEIPLGGYHAVLQAIVDRIGHDRISLNMPVTTIDTTTTTTRSGPGVQITCQDGTNLYGDYCVCTVPLGVLQRRVIQFQPDLPLKRWQALDSIGMGLLDKVILKFDVAFWNNNEKEEDLEEFGVVNEDLSRVQYFYDCSVDFGGDAPILVMFLGGDAARRVDTANGLSDDDIRDEAMRSLRLIFGPDIPNPNNVTVTRWLMDPYSYGAYSFCKVGCAETAYREVAEPIGNLFFAGEHTSLTAYACVHGAWETGEREARRLLHLIQQQAKKERMPGT